MIFSNDLLAQPKEVHCKCGDESCVIFNNQIVARTNH